MRKMVSGLFMSLDGVVEADDDWQFAYFDEEMFGVITAWWERADAVLMGRRSFKGYASLRSEHPDSPMLAFLDGVDRYVVSTTLSQADWPGTTVLGDDLRGRLLELKRPPGEDIFVPGSPTLVRWLLGQRLLDELNVSILPIIVGSGDRLFPDSPDDSLARLGLELANSSVLRSGVLNLAYTPAVASRSVG